MQPTSTVVEVHTSAASIVATFPDELLDLREATPLDDPPWVFALGNTYRFDWSHPADLAIAGAPKLRWQGPHSPGSEVSPPHWSSSGSVTGTDELTFVVPVDTSNGTGDGVAIISVATETGDVASCVGAARCTYALSHPAAPHLARSTR